MVAETIVKRTHPAQARRAVSESEFLRDTAGRIAEGKRAADAAGKHAGGWQQVKGHFVEALDVETYNRVNARAGKKLVPMPKPCAPTYDARRHVNGQFAGAVQQKSSERGVRRAIQQMERNKPGSARNGVIRVPRDKLEAGRRAAGGRVKEVKPMGFTNKQAEKHLDAGLDGLARKGAAAQSQARALRSGSTLGAASSVVVGGLGELGALRRGEIRGRDYLENRVVDAAEGGGGTVVQTLAANGGRALVVWALPASGPAAPIVAGVVAGYASGKLVTAGFRVARRRLDEHRGTEGEHAATELALLESRKITRVNFRGRSVFASEEAEQVCELLEDLATANGDRAAVLARLRRRGFYASDWRSDGRDLEAQDFEVLVALGELNVVDE